jgi:predicted MFS family arabinose efflux permease
MLAGPERAEEPAEKPAEFAIILRRPGVLPSMVAAMASFSTMVAIMTLTGVVVVDRGHPADVVFPIIGAHVVGMYALVIVVGDLIDRIGRTRALVGGLALMAASAISLIWFTSVATIAFTLFALGLGWSFSFVAATAQLADRTSPVERGKDSRSRSRRRAGSSAIRCAFGQPGLRRPRSTDGWYNRPSADARSADFLCDEDL